MTSEQAVNNRVSVSPSRMKLTGDGTEGVFLGTRCKECELHILGDSMFCPRCTSAEHEPVELSSNGRLYSYTVIHVPPPGWKGQVPFVLGAVKLPEGPHVTSEVINADPQTIEIDSPMTMVLQPGDTDEDGREIMVYKWEAAKA